MAWMTPSPLTPEPSDQPPWITLAFANAARHWARVPWLSEPEPPTCDGAASLTNCAEPLLSHQSLP